MLWVGKRSLSITFLILLQLIFHTQPKLWHDGTKIFVFGIDGPTCVVTPINTCSVTTPFGSDDVTVNLEMLFR